MKRHLTRYAILAILLILLHQLAVAQKVRHVKVTPQNAHAYRDSLMLKVFGTTVFPYDIFPDAVFTNVSSIDYYGGFPYSSILYPTGNLDSVDKFEVRPSPNTTDFPDPVPAYLFHPHNSNGKLFIYHSGHCAATAPNEDVLGNAQGTEPGIVIPALVKAGFTVLAVPMIYYGNPTPGGLSCGYNAHDSVFLQGHYPFPLSLFFKPLIASLNQAGRSNYSAVYMCGLSGGGWTTSIYPAMDTSVVCSFPVAGSWPLPVNLFYNGVGDMEQFYFPLYGNLLDYHELYTLGCLAPERKMLQINNRYDACCFKGSVAHVFYMDTVMQALQGTQGVYKFYLDETETGHQVTPRAMEIMLTFLQNDTAFLLNKPVDSVINGQAYAYDIKNNFGLTTAPDNSVLKFSLLKAPGWLTLDEINGVISGTIPQLGIIANPDTISFKVEDSTGRFVVYDYILKKRRSEPYFFIQPDDSTTVYFLPGYSGSIQTVNPGIISSFFTNSPGLLVTGISVQNNSMLKLKMNRQVLPTDSIGYNGYTNVNAVTYINGLKLDDFGLAEIHMDVVQPRYALAGMIRFNTDTNKFEYFNGVSWINLNQ